MTIHQNHCLAFNRPTCQFKYVWLLKALHVPDLNKRTSFECFACGLEKHESTPFKHYPFQFHDEAPHSWWTFYFSTLRRIFDYIPRQYISFFYFKIHLNIYLFLLDYLEALTILRRNTLNAILWHFNDNLKYFVWEAETTIFNVYPPLLNFILNFNFPKC